MIGAGKTACTDYIQLYLEDIADQIIVTISGTGLLEFDAFQVCHLLPTGMVHHGADQFPGLQPLTSLPSWCQVHIAPKNGCTLGQVQINMLYAGHFIFSCVQTKNHAVVSVLWMSELWLPHKKIRDQQKARNSQCKTCTIRRTELPFSINDICSPNLFLTVRPPFWQLSSQFTQAPPLDKSSNSSRILGPRKAPNKVAQIAGNNRKRTKTFFNTYRSIVMDKTQANFEALWFTMDSVFCPFTVVLRISEYAVKPMCFLSTQHGERTKWTKWVFSSMA